jgi:hypothetical protein
MLLESGNRQELIRSVFNRALLVDFHGAGPLHPPFSPASRNCCTRQTHRLPGRLPGWPETFDSCQNFLSSKRCGPEFARALLVKEDCHTAVFL